MQPIMRQRPMGLLRLNTSLRSVRQSIESASMCSRQGRGQQAYRHASTVGAVAASGASRTLNFFYGTTLLLGLGIVFVYVTDTRAGVHRWVVVPALRWAYPDPERAHEVGNAGLKALWRFGLYPRERGVADERGDLAVEVFGTVLKNPIGTSAGIDKHAEIPDPLMAIGPAIVEIGGTTPQPQPGNDKPRVFRLSSQNAFINRYGLNSEGADHIAAALRQRVREYAHANGIGIDHEAEKFVLDGKAGVPPGSLTAGKLLAINIAKNKSTPENDVQAVSKDYVYCVEKLAPYADILVVNVSSPNTPGLRSLQQGDTLKKILSAVVESAKRTDRESKPAVMVKVSPDENSDEQVAGICQAVWESGVDGVIVGNTTNNRPKSLPHLKNLTPTEEQYLLEQGGFSGPHLFEGTVALVKKYKKKLAEKPSSSETPSRSPGSLSAEADKLKSSLKSSGTSASAKDTTRVTQSIDTEAIPFGNLSEKSESEKTPLINLPTSRFYQQPVSEQNSLRSDPSTADSAMSPTPERNAKNTRGNTSSAKSDDEGKVIFATGGITNGKQALEVLNAGASVAMVYTALVYGGAGTISRIKDEMRQEIQAQKTVQKTAKLK